jgi:hypothetical protein
MVTNSGVLFTQGCLGGGEGGLKMRKKFSPKYYVCGSFASFGVLDR